MNKQLAKLVLLFLTVPLCLYSQTTDSSSIEQETRLPGKEVLPAAALKTNLLTDLTGTFNLGVEFRSGRSAD